jgi:hypothetical protein
MTPHISNGVRPTLAQSSQQGEEGILFDTSDSSETDASGSEESDSYSEEGEREGESEDDIDLAAEKQLLASQSERTSQELQSQSQSQSQGKEATDDEGDDSESDSEDEEDTLRVEVPRPASPSLSSPAETNKPKGATRSAAAKALEELNSRKRKRELLESSEAEREQIVEGSKKIARSKGTGKLVETQPRVLERTFLSPTLLAAKVEEEKKQLAEEEKRRLAMEKAKAQALEDDTSSRKRKRGPARAPLSEEYINDDDEEEAHLTAKILRRPRKSQPNNPPKAVAPSDEDSCTNDEAITPKTLPASMRRNPAHSSKKTKPPTSKAPTNGVVPTIELSSFPSPATTTTPPSASDAALLQKALTISTPQSRATSAKNRFTPYEKSLLNTFRDQYCAQNNITPQLFNAYVQSTQRGDAIEGKAKTTFWAGIKSVLPRRDVFSLQRYMRRTYHQLSVGKWTPEAEAELEALVAEYGSKWKLIAERMERTMDDVYSHFKNKVKNMKTQKASRWEKQEVDMLVEAVTSILRMKGKWDGGDDVKKLLLQEEKPDVSWSQISSLMNNARSAQQCSQKWETLRKKAREILEGRELDLYNRKKWTARKKGRRKDKNGKNVERRGIEGYLARQNGEDEDTEDPIEDASGDDGVEIAPQRESEKTHKDAIVEDSNEEDDEEESESESDSESESESEGESDAQPSAKEPVKRTVTNSNSKPFSNLNDDTSSEDEDSESGNESESSSGSDSDSESESVSESDDSSE